MRSLTILFSSLLLGVASLSVRADDPTAFDNPGPVNEFITEMVKEYKFNNADLTELFKQVRIHQSIIDAISRPAESKPWY